MKFHSNEINQADRSETPEPSLKTAASASAMTRTLRLCGYFFAAYCLCSAEMKHDWNAVSYTFRTLEQTGGPNLLPAPTENGKAWQFSNGAKAVPIHGAAGIELGPRSNPGAASFKIHVPAAPLTLYRLSWTARFRSDTVLDFGASYPGLHGWLVPMKEKGTGPGPIRLREVRPLGPWRHFEVELFTQADTRRIRFSLAANIVKGSAQLRDLSLRACTITPAEGRQVIVAGDQQWAEARRTPEPPPPRRITAFHRRNFDKLFSYSRPAPSETNPELLFEGVPGEVVVSSLAVFCPRSLERLRLDTSDAPALSSRG